MPNAVVQVPPPVNEPVLSYAPGTNQRSILKQSIETLKGRHLEVTPIIGGRPAPSGNTLPIQAPHNHGEVLGELHLCTEADVERAVVTAVEARREWAAMPWHERAAIFLRAADLLAGPRRSVINAACMVDMSKSAHQAEIDSACELIDFFRFNVHFMERIYRDQPISSPGIWNRTEYRALEGFVFAITPFNFASIAGNLPTAPAIMGNTVLWKPATSASYTAYHLYQLLEEAGLPPGVINFLPGRGSTVGGPTFASPHFAGLHFTGSTSTFQAMWKIIGGSIESYRTYPRIVGETGGKDFIIAHSSADPIALATAVVRGGFEYQGQKCSAASRVYIPGSLWSAFEMSMHAQLEEIKIGPVDNFENFMNAVIDREAYDKITGYIARAKDSDAIDVLFGGEYSDEEGFFIQPTVLRTTDPVYETMVEEIFGPVVTIYVYDEARFDETLDLVESTSPYALTGAVFATDRSAVIKATRRLADAAGNFYINDKPTGAVVGQQPFGGARASGTNDKAGSYLNLIRWTSARSVKETFNPPHHFSYPFMEPEVSDI